MVFFQKIKKCKSEEYIAGYIFLCTSNKTSETIKTLFYSAAA